MLQAHRGDTRNTTAPPAPLHPLFSAISGFFFFFFALDQELCPDGSDGTQRLGASLAEALEKGEFCLFTSLAPIGSDAAIWASERQLQISYSWE